MSKHTPGPWCAIPPRIGAAITIYGRDGKFPVATTCSNSAPATMVAHREGTAAANARLIAAAPELLEALQEMVECFWGTEEDPSQGKAVAQARAAIAKATVSAS